MDDNNLSIDIASGTMSELETQVELAKRTHTELCEIIINLVKIIQLQAERIEVLESNG